jgi:hypothetical protein
MIAIVDNQERVDKTRQQLNELRSRGFRFLVTTNDGDTWEGNEESGLEIDELLVAGFVGKISVQGE